MNNLNNKNKINNYLKEHSYLELDGDIDLHYSDSDILDYSTRRNGNVGDEEFSYEDYEHACLMKKNLLKLFSDVDIDIETVDEWVYLNVSFNQKGSV